jgi:hypothetical protein
MKFLAYFWNPKAKRDKRGRVIEDIPRRLESRRTTKLLKTGIKQQGQKDYTTGGRKYRVGIKGRVEMEGDSK